VKKSLKIILLIAVVIVIALVVWRIISNRAQVVQRSKGPVVVKVELPIRQELVRSLQLTGNLLPIREAQVYARVYGNLESVDANIGDFVKKNQVLAQIDTTELAQQFRKAEATYRDAASKFERIKALWADTLISKQGFDSAETAYEVAKENYETAGTQLGYATITAPFAGYITWRYLDPGTYVTAGNSSLFTLMDSKTIKIIVNVLEKDVPLVAVGMPAVLTVESLPGRQFAGSTARLAEAVDLATRTMPVEIDIPNQGDSLKPGMLASQ
jgi:RND family efflux transporter MFP subunit